MEPYRDKPFNGLNDLCFDMAGNSSSSPTPKGSGTNLPFRSGVPALDRGGPDPSRQPSPLPNGITIDPDQTKLYVSDTATNSILVWDLAPDGTVASRRILYKFPDASVDGISFDEAGRLWVARLDHASLDVLSKGGRLLKSYPITSAGKVTNMAWWEHSLYVTTTVENVIRRFDLPFGGAPAIPKAGMPALGR